jgi:anti-sigma B factor antagonist
MNIADLQVRTHDGVVIATVTGEIDMSNANDLRGAILESTPNGALGLVLDFTKLTYIDSTGVHLLYRLGESLRARGQTLRVVIPTGSPASDALRLAGVQRHVDVVTELEEGVRAVAVSATQND